jgi:hypothetical protein
MDCLAPVAYHAVAAAGGGAGISKETFAALDTTLGAAADGSVGELRTADGLVGHWQVWSGSLYAISEIDLRYASSGTFRAATDYILHGSIGATWATPGAATGGLTLDTNGAVSWPCLGLWKGYGGNTVTKSRFVAIGLGTGPVASQTLGAVGLYSPADTNQFSSGLAYSTTLSEFTKSLIFGTIAAPTISVSNNAINSLGATPTDVLIYCGQQGNDTVDTQGGYTVNATLSSFASVPANRPRCDTATSLPTFTQTDMRLAVYFHDQSTGGTSRLRSVEVMGDRA